MNTLCPPNRPAWSTHDDWHPSQSAHVSEYRNRQLWIGWRVDGLGYVILRGYEKSADMTVVIVNDEEL